MKELYHMLICTNSSLVLILTLFCTVYTVKLKLILSMSANENCYPA